jgi:hypothetical protein
MAKATSPYRVEMTAAVRPATTAAIRRFEAKFDCNIPPEYVQFLLQHNGGTPKRNYCHDGKGSYQDFEIQHFFGIRPTGFDSLEIAWKVYAGRIPRDTFPIADDAGDNLVLIAQDKKRRGSILFWDHEDEMSRKPARVVSKSLRALLSKLKADEPKKLELVLIRWTDGTSERKVLPYCFVSLDRQQVVDVLDMKAGERIEEFGQSKVFKSVERIAK